MGGRGDSIQFPEGAGDRGRHGADGPWGGNPEAPRLPRFERDGAERARWPGFQHPLSRSLAQLMNGLFGDVLRCCRVRHALQRCCLASFSSCRCHFPSSLEFGAVP